MIHLPLDIVYLFIPFTTRLSDTLSELHRSFSFGRCAEQLLLDLIQLTEGRREARDLLLMGELQFTLEKLKTNYNIIQRHVPKRWFQIKIILHVLTSFLTSVRQDAFLTTWRTRQITPLHDKPHESHPLLLKSHRSLLPLQAPLSSSSFDPYISLVQHQAWQSSCQSTQLCYPPLIHDTKNKHTKHLLVFYSGTIQERTALVWICHQKKLFFHSGFCEQVKVSAFTFSTNTFYKEDKKYSKVSASSALITHCHHFEMLPCIPYQITISVRAFLIMCSARD